jgi:hypothetical protein
MKMGVEHLWNDNDRGKLKYWEKNLSHCHLPRTYLTIADLGSNTGHPGQRPTTNCLNHGVTVTYPLLLRFLLPS